MWMGAATDTHARKQASNKLTNVPASSTSTTEAPHRVCTEKESDRTSERYALHIKLMCERFMVGHCMSTTTTAAATVAVACKHIPIHASEQHTSNTFSLNLKTIWVQLSANNETINTRRHFVFFSPFPTSLCMYTPVYAECIHTVYVLFNIITITKLVCITSRKAFQSVHIVKSTIFLSLCFWFGLV